MTSNRQYIRLTTFDPCCQMPGQHLHPPDRSVCLLSCAGESAITCLTAVLDVVDIAFINHENLHALRDRALDLLEVIYENRTALLDSRRHGGGYKHIMSKYQDVLQVCDDAFLSLKSFDTVCMSSGASASRRPTCWLTNLVLHMHIGGKKHHLLSACSCFSHNN